MENKLKNIVELILNFILYHCCICYLICWLFTKTCIICNQLRSCHSALVPMCWYSLFKGCLLLRMSQRVASAAFTDVSLVGTATVVLLLAFAFPVIFLS